MAVVMKEAVGAVLNRKDHYTEAQDYYDGNVPETFATAKLRRAFRTTGDRSRLNFCRPVIDAVNDRVLLASITGGTKAATAKIQEISENNDLGIEAQEIHRAALISGDAFVMAWPDVNGEWQISTHSPLNMSLVYDPENPRKKAYAVHLWKSASNEHRMNIILPDRIRKFVANVGEVSDGSNWTEIEGVDNPWGEVPVFHFRTHRPYGRPEHYDAYDAQNAINKLFITNMNTIDYQGAPQRFALESMGADGGETQDFKEGDTDRENLNALKNGPGEVWFMKGVSSMGEFKPADPAVFWTPIKDLQRAISALTGTPLHYFEKTGNVPSGNALRTAEAPLLKKVSDREASFGYAWRDLFRFILRAEGIVTTVSVYWKAVESLDELERWDVALKKINSGLSHRQALREGGYSDPEIEKIMAERKQEAADGLMYQRAPQTRVNTSNDKTQALQPVDTTTGN